MSKTKPYCVTVKIYTWAVDENAAIDQVISELDYICEGDSLSKRYNKLAGFIHPNLADVVEDKEPLRNRQPRRPETSGFTRSMIGKGKKK